MALSLGAVAQSTAPTRPPAMPTRAAAAAPVLPAVNLWVELRQIDEAVQEELPVGRAATVLGTRPSGASQGAVWSTSRAAERDPAALLAQLRVQNGGRAQMGWRRDQPFEWLSEVWAPGLTGPGTASARPRAATAGASRQAVWVPAGREIEVSARWPGANSPVSIDLAVADQVPDSPTGSLPPATLQSRTAASVLAPLGQWVTVARIRGPDDAGHAAPPPGSIGTRPIALPPVLLQVRVRASAPAVPPTPGPQPPR